MKILVADDISAEGLKQLDELPEVNVDRRTGLSEGELCQIIGDYDGLLVRSQTQVTSKVIEHATSLKVIGRAGVGVDNIDVEAATRHGIIVVNAPDGNTMAAAEHTFAMLMAAARSIPQADASIRAGKWDRKTFVGVELRGKTLAVLGLGRIGTEVAKRALAFEMTVIGMDPFLTEDRASDLGITKASLQDAIAQADFITVHTPLTKDTKHMIGRDAFQQMKDGVRIVNCARGGIIDESALVDALRTGKVAAAAIDVFETEPLVSDHPLRDLANVILTPHLGASTVEAQVNVAVDVAVEFGRVLSGLPANNAVNLPPMSKEQKAFLEPYLVLGEQLGLFAAQWLNSLSNLEITYGGDLANHDTSFVTRTVLKGIFDYRLGENVNYVNAPLLAKQRGLSVREIKQPKSRVFNTYLTLSVESEDGVHRVTGTLYNGSGPRIVEIDGYAVDAPPRGKILFTRHSDKPGMIGRIGTWLGNADINIAGMQVGRRETGGEAIMLLSVDKVVPEDVVGQIARMDGIQSVRSIEL